MKRSRLIVFYLVLISFPVVLKAQQNSYGSVTISSPTAAALGKYADIPVSYHTGIPQINIPLYTVKAGSLELPIGLSYHASGLKVMETASWVGAGWSLDAGGVITRTVMGLPDEKGTGSGLVDLTGYYTDSGYNKVLYQGGADQDWRGFAEGRKDGEPDLFFFNFGGYSGKFFFRDDHTPVLVPQQDIKIIPYFPHPGYQSIQGFTIITPDGNQYLFGNTPNVTGTPPIELTNPYSIQNGYFSGTAISSWYLNKVISYDGVFSINLSYAPESYGYYTLSNNPLDPTSSLTVELGLIKNIISGVRLSNITFPNGKVDFIPGQVRTDLGDDQHIPVDSPNTSATSLGEIHISNNDSSFCKKYIFSYGYFVDNVTVPPTILNDYSVTLLTDRSRLRLDSVKEQTCDNLLQIPARRFTYFGEMVPRRLTLAQDHWGFFNGVTSNQTLIPTYAEISDSILTTKTGADRNGAWPAMRGGSLNKMTYPTGGSVIFDFEPADSYTKSISTPQMVDIDHSRFSVHMYGQGSQYADTVYIVSNGEPVSMTTTNNTSDFQAHVVIKDSTGATVYSNFFGNDSYPGTQTQTYPPISLHAGSYSIILNIPTDPSITEGQGAGVFFQQLTNVPQYFNITIGGLRIRTITQQDSANNSVPIITTYTYPNGGYLYSFPTYVQHLRNDLITNLGYYEPGVGFEKGLGNINGCPLSGSYYVRSGGSLRPMATTQGYHIGYGTVQVSQSGNGYSKYFYYTSNSGYGEQGLTPAIPTIDVSLFACEPTTPNYPPAPLPFDYLKGELKYEEHHNQNGDLLKQTFYYPTFDTASIQPAPAFIVQSRDNAGSQMLLGTLYNVSSARKTSLHTVETDYFPGQSQGIQQDTYTYYESPYHNQVTRKVVTTSTGDNLVTKTMYAPDFHSAAWDISPSCESTYTTNCNTCQTQYNTGRSACSGPGVDTCITNRFLDFRRCLSTARNNYVNSRFANYTGIDTATNLPNNNYATQHNTTKGSAGAELKPILDLQDENRIVPIEISDYRDSSLLKSNFTRYDYMPYPANIPFPNKTQLVNLANPSATFTKAAISGTTLTKDSRYLDESIYGFNKGNVTRVTGHDGLNTMYIWDYQNTNPIAKTVSATTDSTAFSSFEADGTGNWTLSTGGGNTSQVSVSVAAAASDLNTFTTQTPLSGTVNDHMPTTGQELGMKFTAAVSGTVKGVRFYKTSGNTGTHIGELYSSAGTRLAQATFTGETSSGWQTVNFSSPVSITAGTTYTIAYFSSAGNFTEDDNYFLHNSVTNGVLTAPADGTNGASGTDPGTGQGTFKYTSSAAFPNQLYESANYWVDVIFTPSTTPFANAGATQTITLPTSTIVLDGSGSTGTITSFSWTKISGPNTPTITSPSSTFSSVNGLIQGIYVFQLSLNSGASTAQVTINVQAAGTPTGIFTSQVPTNTLQNDGQAIELGVKFRASTTGSITGIRFYKQSGNSGTHIGELYSSAGTRLAQATFSGETSTGWQTVLFSTPVAVTVNTTYVAAYWSSGGNYSETSNFFASALTNGTMTALADGTDGHNSIYKYTASAAYPSTYTVMADKPTYWVDALFVPDNTPVPNAGNNLSVTLPVSSVTLNGSNSNGNISNYLWTKVSGPGSPVIVSPTSSTTNVTGLTAGSYVFQLAVNGASNSAFSLTGTKSYNMAGNTVSKSGLTSGKKYIISYWTRGSALSFSGGTSTSTTGRTVNGWTYHEHTVTMTSATINITGTGYIDELRLYPQGAQMTSYTYQRLTGLSSMNDPNSEITYYDYDGLQRLKNIRDYQGNIVKNYQYNYSDPSSCGGNCYTVGMQTFAGTSTLSYPVGVFSLTGKLLGNATNQTQYISTWMSDTTDANTGTITAGPDSLHFRFSVNAGRSLPNALTGLRFYQFDLAYTNIDALRYFNAAYVDFGDGTGMRLGNSFVDTNVVIAPNTYLNPYTYSSGPSNPHVYWNHTYPDSSQKTLTFYHNDGNENMTFDNGSWPANSLIHLKNFRGNYPQNSTDLTATCFQQSSALTISNITNWNSITSLLNFGLRSGDILNPCLNISYAQDFMANNRNLQSISTDPYGLYTEGSEDTTFKISRLKTNWNTYFTNLTTLYINDADWNREDLTALVHLNNVLISASNLHHSYNSSGNPLVQIPANILDAIINQIAAGAGQTVSNGFLGIYSGGTVRTSASDTAYNFLISKGWTVTINPAIP